MRPKRIQTQGNTRVNYLNANANEKKNHFLALAFHTCKPGQFKRNTTGTEKRYENKRQIQRK